MTRAEAIKEIDKLRDDIGSAYDDADQSLTWYALGMAIDALNEKKDGKWSIRRSKTSGVIFYHCSCCEWCNTHWVKYPYCPICGARMEAADEP